MHILFAEITNSSNKDFQKLVFEFSVPFGCAIYRHQGQLLYDDLTKDLSLQKDFNDQFENVKKRQLATTQNKQGLWRHGGLTNKSSIYRYSATYQSDE